jgi:hypothetical protein
MVWILFVYLSTFATSGGIAVASAEFNTAEACAFAGDQIKDNFKTAFTQTPRTICVPKGE